MLRSVRNIGKLALLLSAQSTSISFVELLPVKQINRASEVKILIRSIFVITGTIVCCVCVLFEVLVVRYVLKKRLLRKIVTRLLRIKAFVT